MTPAPFDTWAFIRHINPPTSQKQPHFESIAAKNLTITLVEIRELLIFYT